MERKKFYITTAIDYVNSNPHIGHALEKCQADALARYHRLKGEEVFFLTGTDEHGTKVYRAAQEAGKDTREFCDEVAQEFRDLIELLNVDIDFFIRTSDPDVHWPGAQKMWKLAADDIEKRDYEGLYCVGCESFLTERELEDGKCPVHKEEPEELEEENYFFRLSKYEDEIREAIEEDVYRVVPESKKNEVLSFIEDGLDDISVSRPKEVLPWGVPVPGDEEHTEYVWVDALSNYATGVGFGRDEETFGKWWPADVHVIGKDILRFHAIIWPGILLSAGLPLPENLFVHGFITSGGEKMSKSLGNVIDPVEYAERYGTDPLRYYLLAEIPSTDDGDFTRQRFVEVNNSALADDLGNLVMRAAKLTNKELEGKHPQKTDTTLREAAETARDGFMEKMDRFEIDRAVKTVWKFIREVNGYLNEAEPWNVEDEDEVEEILYNVTEALRFVSALSRPIIPATSGQINDQFSFPEPSLDGLEWGKVVDGKIEEGEPLFEKYSAEEVEEDERDPFTRLDLQAARIEDVRDHPDADKLYVLTVSLGEEERQLVAGLRGHYSPDELEGKRIVVLTNLEPATIRGERSEGMLLAGEEGDEVGLLTVDAEPGTRVSVEGIETNPVEEVSIDEFGEIDMVVKDNGVYYGDHVLRADGKKAKAERVGEGAEVK